MSEPVRHLFTATEAERVLGIPAATVRSWARRKQVWPFGLDAAGAPMYDRDDLVRLRERRQTRDHDARARRASSATRTKRGHTI